MAIKRQEFYEGAALHLLIRNGRVEGVRYDPPFFQFNARLLVLLKYCARSRSPWGFTFTANEQKLLETKAALSETAIGLICGADGVAAVNYQAFRSLISKANAAIHIACYRHHGEHYEISGPAGVLNRKVSPSSWQKILQS